MLVVTKVVSALIETSPTSMDQEIIALAAAVAFAHMKKVLAHVAEEYITHVLERLESCARTNDEPFHVISIF